jgi:dCTP deaminase
VVLSDRDITEALATGQLVVDPIGENAVQPASVDIRLDRYFRVFRNHRATVIDPREPMDDLTVPETIAEDETFVLHPGEFVLASTIERVKLADDLVARIDGKSSLGRLGLLVHATAGYVDPGWDGQLTLELSNVATLPIKLYYGMKIGQLSFQALSSPAIRPYGHADLKSRYQGQTRPEASRIHRDFQGQQ